MRKVKLVLNSLPSFNSTCHWNPTRCRIEALLYFRLLLSLPWWLACWALFRHGWCNLAGFIGLFKWWRSVVQTGVTFLLAFLTVRWIGNMEKCNTEHCYNPNLIADYKWIWWAKMSPVFMLLLLGCFGAAAAHKHVYVPMRLHLDWCLKCDG